MNKNILTFIIEDAIVLPVAFSATTISKLEKTFS
jgi:hypothetical protein